MIYHSYRHISYAFWICNEQKHSFVRKCFPICLMSATSWNWYGLGHRHTEFMYAYDWKRHCISVEVRLISGIKLLLFAITVPHMRIKTHTNTLQYQLIHYKSLSTHIFTKIIYMDFVIVFIRFATAKYHMRVSACFSILVDSFVWCFAQCGSATIGKMPQYQFVCSLLKMHSSPLKQCSLFFVFGSQCIWFFLPRYSISWKCCHFIVFKW